ncbi:MAG: LysM peptidoglycan-binding domain-containing protein [Deltaproteobacteria bacterium]|jgi:membrane-bound lytic murein transglycosylase D|nr:LysM peptidoglycan-binding domain-containing protein [Deltaproteobacteria bacterium]
MRSKIVFSLLLPALVALALSSCGGRVEDSAMRRTATDVARGSLNGNLKYYRLGPQFEKQLSSMVDTEFTSLAARKEDIPIEINQEVLVNINSFLNDRRGFMTRSLSRGQKYIPLMKAILRQKGLPENLVYLALIESGFRTEAVSVASAVGPWQFIAETGRRYGLIIDQWVDERRDPVKSTYAAADYLTTLHDMFNSWPLAIAAYNSGEGKIARGLQRPDVDNYWDMSRERGFLADETKRYVPSFLAAAIIARDPVAYGLEVEWSPPDTWDEVVIIEPLELMTAAQLSHSSLERIQELNPHLRKLTTPPNLPDFVLRIPSGTRAMFYQQYAKLPGPQKKGAFAIHVASRGETLERVARDYNADLAQLREFNSLTGNPRLQAGQEIVIPMGLSLPPLTTLASASPATQAPPPSALPTRTASATPPPQIAVPASPPPTPARAPAPTPPPTRTTRASSTTPVIQSVSHVVRSGDTLSSVSKLYGVDMDKLRADNGLSGTTLYVGQILTVRSNIPLQAQSRPEARPRNSWVVVSEGAPLYYTVQRGDTISAIAEKHQVTQAQLRELNNLRGNSIRAGQKLVIGTGPAPSAAPAYRTADYAVKAGDTVSVIAERFGMKTDELRSLNSLSGDAIRVGQTLKVKDAAGGGAAPSGADGDYYVVASGDTASVLAERYHLRLRELLDLNNLQSDVLRPGQRLLVRKPGGGARAQDSRPRQEVSYAVKPGDTLSVIAENAGMRLDELRALNGLKNDSIRPGQTLKILSAPAADAQSPPSAPPAASPPALASDGPAAGSYVVQAGDTLSVIAENAGMRLDELRALNGLKNDSIRPGQTLKLAPSRRTASQDPPAPAPLAAPSGGGSYTVRPGDTLSVIAEKVGMRTQDLRDLNNLSSDSIRPGQTLRIAAPGASPAATPPVAAPTPPLTAPSGGGSYTVLPGDTLSVIAEKVGMRTQALRDLNNLSSDSIRPGQTLRIAASAASPPAATPPVAAPPVASPQAPPNSGNLLAPAQIPLGSGPSRASAPAPAPAPAPRTTSSGGSYTVLPGDTLSVIAEKVGMRTQALRDLNNLSSDSIRPGQILRTQGSAPAGGAPATASYTVQSGDTMYSIARRFNMTVDALKALNAKTSNSIRPGETLKVQ